MTKPLQYVGQGLFYALFMGVIGYFATSPSYTHLQPDETLIKLSFSHAGHTKGECRERSAEELAKLPAYQRKGGTVCPRERADVVFELEIDGKQFDHVVMKPAGLSHSGNSNIYRRIPVKAGVHTLKARLKDREGEGFNYEHEETMTLAPGRIVVIDFKSATGGFIFKNKNAT
ncbi:MAG: hypothetical protein K2P67_01125 [Gallionellaceae bacterium]|jgi:hypothetical protein|nr:hypothetical protein [Gallionellaceae bacterium]